MARKEIEMAIEWAAKEGWNPGLHDAECYFAADPNGFLMGLLGDKPIATISAVKYGESFGFLGLYMVKPEYRGKGYGIQIWNAGMRYLEGRSIGSWLSKTITKNPGSNWPIATFATKVWVAAIPPKMRKLSRCLQCLLRRLIHTTGLSSRQTDPDLSSHG